MSDGDNEVRAIPLADTRAALPIALLRAREAVMERFRPLLTAHGITEQQWRVLRVLGEADGLDAGELAARACVLPPSLTRILRALEARDYVQVTRDPQDRRRSILALTDGGAALLRQVAPESNAIYSDIARRVGAERLEALLGELEALLPALSEQGTETKL